jgi:hypothetical protein
MIGEQKKHNLQYLISNQPDGSRKVKYLIDNVHEFIPIKILRRQEVVYETKATPHKKDPIQFPRTLKHK